jgi:drug/metabolite transporter (DMT)-like permease
MSAPLTASTIRPVVISHPWLGLWCGVGAATLFAGKAVLVRIGYQHGAGTTDLLALRMLVSLPCFAVIAWWMGRGVAPLGTGERVRLLLLGVLGYHVASWLDFAGLQHIDAALERVVLFIYPTLVTGWALMRGTRTLTRPLAVALAATYGGILLTWGDRVTFGGQGAHTVLGVVWVALSALAFAIHLVLCEDQLKRLGGIRAMAIAMLGAGATILVQALIEAPPALFHPSTGALWCGVALGIVATVIPCLLGGLAIQHLGAARAAVVGCVAPVATALLGWAFLGEVLGTAAWAGCVLTMWGALAAGRTR